MGADRPGLEEIARAAGTPGRGPPPVHLWNPAHCGTIDIVIKANGQWFHEGAPIDREPLVRLFASVLRLDPDGYVLVTPVEKLGIVVEDAPFVAVAVDIAPDRLTFTTNVGDVVEAGLEHALRIGAGPDGAPRPYLHVRRGLEALIARPVFYELAAVSVPDPGTGAPAVSSNGVWFSLDTSA